MSKVLIFGIGGFVGSYLTEEFLKEEYEVFGSDVADNDSITKKVGFYQCDLLDFDAVKSVIVKVNPDMVINLAAISSVGVSWNIPQTTMSVNVVGALNILEAARQLDKIPKIMFIGSSEEYAESDKPIDENTPLNANNPYGISKMTQERFADIYRDRYGMKIYCVRPFNHTGIGQRETFVFPSFCKQVADIEKSGKDGVIKVGNLSAKRDFSDVRDTVRAYRMIIENEDDSVIYNVGYGTSYTIEEILRYIISLSKQKVEIEVDKERFRPIDTPVIGCDNSLIIKNLGWKPEYSIFDTVKGMFEYYVKN